MMTVMIMKMIVVMMMMLTTSMVLTLINSFNLACALIFNIYFVWKFHNLKKTRNNFKEVSMKFHEVSLLLNFMKFRKKWALKLLTIGGGSTKIEVRVEG